MSTKFGTQTASATNYGDDAIDKPEIHTNVIDFMKRSRSEIVDDLLEYVKIKQQEESILFLQSVQKYKEVLREQNIQSKEIHETYLKPGSEYAINVDQDALSEITEDELATRNIFETLEDEVARLSNSSILPDYISSPEYARIVERLEGERDGKLILNFPIKVEFIPVEESGRRRESDPLSVLRRMGSSFSTQKKGQRNFGSTSDLPYTDPFTITFGSEGTKHAKFKVTASGRILIRTLIKTLMKEEPLVYSNDNPSDVGSAETVGIWVDTLSMWLSMDQPLSAYSKYLGERTRNVFRLKRIPGLGGNENDDQVLKK